MCDQPKNTPNPTETFPWKLLEACEIYVAVRVDVMK